MKRKLKFKMSDIPVYEHLEYDVKHTTYTHRLQWLQQANEWFWLLEKKKIIPKISSR